jgi:hypothetical protein
VGASLLSFQGIAAIIRNFTNACLQSQVKFLIVAQQREVNENNSLLAGSLTHTPFVCLDMQTESDKKRLLFLNSLVKPTKIISIATRQIGNDVK